MARHFKASSQNKAVLLLLCLAPTITAMAGGNTRQYYIPAQSLNNALMQFATDSHLELMFTAEKIRGLRSESLEGSMTPAQALSQLLQGSGMSYRFVDAKTVTVDTPPSNLIKTTATNETTERQDSSGETLPKVTVEADSENQVYDPAWERDTRNPSYNRTHSSTATKTDAAIMDTPVSIQIVPKKIIDDQQAYDVKEALKSVSGVQLSTSAVDYVNFVIRGFEANASVYKNGFRQDAFAEETSNLERIEVLKGPAAMLYGRIEPGGLVNLQTAKPMAEQHYSLQQQIGSYDFYRTVLDATGPITKDKSLLYRLNFAYRDNDSYRDLAFKERIFLAPSITWNISDRTQANLLLEYQNDDFRGDYGFGVENEKTRPVNLPISRSLSDPAAFDQQESQRLFADWSHAFNDDWKLTHRFMAGFTDYEQYDIFTNPPEIGQTVYSRGLWGVHQDRDIYSTNLDLTGHFDTWGAKHAVLFGFDYYRLDQQAGGYCCDLTGHPLEFIDSLNPVYGEVPREQLLALPKNYFFNSQQDWKGVYFQDQITLFDKLQILGGGRYDWAALATGFSPTSQAEAASQLDTNTVDAEKFSPRVGILYRPWHWLSVYGNYTESLGSNNSNPSASGLPLAPQTADQFEAGFKTELLDKRLTTSVAYFNINKQNIQAFDIANSTDSLRVFKNIGEANSQGLEIDISGQLTDNWNIIAAYAYTDTEITKDTSCSVFDDTTGICTIPGLGNTGNRLPNAALHSGSVWTTYEFDNIFGQNWMSGFSLGTGVFVVGQRQGDFENTFQLPGYVRWDASAAYKWDIGKSRLTAQLNVRNLLDKRYFGGADTIDAFQRGYGSIPGEPLTFLGSIKLEY